MISIAKTDVFAIECLDQHDGCVEPIWQALMLRYFRDDLEAASCLNFSFQYSCTEVLIWCFQTALCWFQTNLLLAALPLRRLASLAVSELQLSVATPLWLFTERQSLPSWIEFNCLRSAAVGKAARLSIYWHDAACRLVIPLQQVTLAQLN